MNTFTDNHMLLEVDASDTTGGVMQTIQAQLEIPPVQQCLLFNEKRMPFSKTLSDYCIDPWTVKSWTHREGDDMGRSVELFSSPLKLILYREKMQIIVENFMTGWIILDVEASDTVLQTKVKVQDKIDLPPHRQHLGFNGTLLDDNHSLSFYEMQMEVRPILLLIPCAPEIVEV